MPKKNFLDRIGVAAIPRADGTKLTPAPVVVGVVWTWKVDSVVEYMWPGRVSDAARGVSPRATAAEINSAYRAKMMKNHPDKVAELDAEFLAACRDSNQVA